MQTSRLLTLSILLAILLTNTYGEEYFITITTAQIVVDDTQKWYSWEIKGHTNFPDKAVFKAELIYDTAMGEKLVQERFIEARDKKFLFSFGLYDREKKMLPGKYIVSVFYSPMFQVDNIKQKLPRVGFTKHRYSTHWGQKEEFAQIFEMQKQQGEALLATIAQLQQQLTKKFMYLHQSRSGLKLWTKFAPRWRKKHSELRQRDDTYGQDLLFPIFESITGNGYALLNLLENLAIEYRKALHGGKNDSFTTLLTLRRWYQRTEDQFRYEIISMAPVPEEFLRAEMENFLSRYASLEKLPPPQQLTIEEQKDFLLFIVELESLQSEVARLSGKNFVMQSNEWLLKLKEEIRDPLSIWQEKKAFADIRVLLENIGQSWYQRAVEVGFLAETKNSARKMAFSQLRDALMDRYKLRSDYVIWKSIVSDLRELQKHVQNLQQKPPESREVLESLKNEWLFRLEQNRKLVVASTSDKRLSEWLQRYNILCIQLLEIYYIIEQGYINEREVEVESLLVPLASQVKTALAELEK